MRAVAAMVAGVALACVGARARAQDVALPPDLVTLTNGGTVRGTLVEDVPGDHVTIQLATGEVRRFASTDVRCVHTGLVTVLAPPEPPHHTVRVYGRGLTLAEITGYGYAGRVPAPIFRALCVAPCSVELEDGFHTLAVSNGGAPQIVARDVWLDSDRRVGLRYVSHADERALGWVGFTLAELVGGALAWVGAIIAGQPTSSYYASLSPSPGDDRGTGDVLIVVGLVIVLAGFAALAPALHADDASIRFG